MTLPGLQTLQNVKIKSKIITYGVCVYIYMCVCVCVCVCRRGGNIPFLRKTVSSQIYVWGEFTPRKAEPCPHVAYVYVLEWF
jgi:hypothetical protein